MIFVTVGSQKFQFNRLLKEVDELIEKEIIKDEVFAQIGVSDYKPKNYEYVNFMSQNDFGEKIDESDMIITHAGTGIIVNSIKKGKKVVAIPRLSKYQEHVDDHQMQLIKEFEELNLIEPVYEINELKNAIEKAKNKKYNRYISNINLIINSIKEFIDK